MRKIWPLLWNANCADFLGYAASLCGILHSKQNLQNRRHTYIACIGLPLIHIDLSTPLGGMHEEYS